MLRALAAVLLALLASLTVAPKGSARAWQGGPATETGMAGDRVSAATTAIARWRALGIVLGRRDREERTLSLRQRALLALEEAQARLSRHDLRGAERAIVLARAALTLASRRLDAEGARARERGGVEARALLRRRREAAQRALDAARADADAAQAELEETDAAP